MDAFPAYIPLSGRKVVVAGDGPMADAKARLFEGSPAQLIRVSGTTALGSAAYMGASLVFIAGDPAFCEAARKAAKGAQVLVNVVDHPELSDFTTPAVIDRGAVVAAVGTTGSAPLLAAMLRNDIESRVPEGSGRVAALLGRLREEVKAAFPDMDQRRAFLREALDGEAAKAAMEGDMTKAEALLREALARGAAKPAARFSIVSGKGPAERLTLGASRVLSRADILIADPDADPQVLSLARRDAERLFPGQADIPALAREGRHVVRVITAPLDPDLLKALAAAGVEIDVLPVAGP